MIESRVNNLLFSMADEKYKNFSSKLTKTKYEIIGVQVPRIRQLAKDLIKQDEAMPILSFDSNYYEVIMLQGNIIANLKVSPEEKIELLKSFVNKIDDWAICDTTLGAIKKCTEAYFGQALTWICSDKEFVCRFGIDILMDRFMDEAHVDQSVRSICEIKLHDYYVEMAIAWYIQRLYTKFKDKAEKMLQNDNLSDFIKKKAQQKICDSLRERKSRSDK